MKAVIYRRFGPPEVMQIEEVEPPVIEAGMDDRVQIEVHSAAVNPFGYLHRRGYWPTRMENGWFRPKTHQLGADVAGLVTAVGRGVTRFQVGDRVFGFCLGAYAEVARAREDRLARMPAGVTFNQAAALPTVALTALQALRDVAGVEAGQHVLVYGASGGIGHIAVQLARHFGAEVTAVTSTANQGWVQALGADHMIDYTREDFARRGRQYDLILDAVGKRTYWSCRRALAPTGIYISEHPLKPRFQLAQFFLSRVFGDRRARMHLAQPNAADLEWIGRKWEEGVLRPVIERCYPLDEIIEAHRHAENGHTKGKVVITVRPT